MGSHLSQVLADVGNEVWLSPISIWQLVLLIEGRRFPSPWAAPAWVEMARQRAVGREAAFTPDVVLEAARGPLACRNPAHRLLTATARWYGLTLVTADRRLLAAQSCALLPNR
ncbi:MAG: type II toxin-antitoxin system VapC family toxin [Terriglobales bacterium]